MLRVCVCMCVGVRVCVCVCACVRACVMERGIAQWLEHQTCDWKVTGLNPNRSSGRIFFSRVNFLCWLLFQYLFHHHVTTVAHKKSQSFCWKCRWQVTAKHVCTLCMWLCMSIVYTERTETTPVSCGTSYVSTVSTPLQWVFKSWL